MKKKFIYLFALFVLLVSCEEVIEVYLGDVPVNTYAVEAKITTLHNPYVYLYQTEKVNKDVPLEGISNAIIKIRDNFQPPKSVILTENSEEKGYYTVPAGKEFKGETGKVYTVEIEVNGMTITATDSLAPVEKIDSIQIKPSKWADYLFLGVYIYGNEPQQKGNFYKWDVYVNEIHQSESINIAVLSDDRINGNYISDYEVFTDFHDFTLPGTRRLKPGSTVQVQQLSLSEFAFNFYSEMYNQSQAGKLFSIPPANIESNFTAGDNSIVHGLFSAHDVSLSDEVVVTPEMESGLKEK